MMESEDEHYEDLLAPDLEMMTRILPIVRLLLNLYLLELYKL